MIELVDVNYDLFNGRNEYQELWETDEVLGIAAGALNNAETDPLFSRQTRLLTPPIYYSLAEGITDNRRINDALLDAAVRLRGHACGVAEPRYAKHALDEMERIAAKGAVATVFSPRAQGCFAGDSVMVEVCHKAAACGMTTMIRSAPYSINESLPRIWDLARACPDTRLVVLGAFGSWENIQLARWNKGGPDNVFYDLSGIAEAHDVAALVRDLGGERLLFGSGGPDSRAHLFGLLERGSVPAADREAIQSTNAKSLFNLSSEGILP